MKNLMLNLNSHMKASRNPGSLQRLGRSVLLSDVPEKDNDGNKDNLTKIMLLDRMVATKTIRIECNKADDIDENEEGEN